MFGLSSLTFAVPAMLAGLTLLAWPLIAHLMQRRPRVYLVFPTIRLLREAVATTSRMSRLRRWLLLVLRCLLVLVLVAAFAQPLWQSAQATPQGQSAAVVLLIDTSASTQQEANGVRAWSSLQAAAERTLSGVLAGTDLVNAVEACGRPRALLPRLTPNLTAVRRAVQELKPTGERADLSRAIALAAEQLSQHAGTRRLVILSDLQRTNWSTVTPTPLPSGTQVTVVEPQADPPGSVALSAPRCFPAQPLSGQAAQLVVRVTNFAARERQAKLAAVLDGRDLPAQTVTLKPGEDRDVVFAAELTAPGEHLAEFHAPRDGFAPDDSTALVLTASDRLPVLILSDDLPSDAGSGTFFLSRALAPTGTEADRFDVRQILVRDLPAANLAAAGLMFVGYLGDLDVAGASRLVEFVRKGGSIVFFCGEGSVARHLDRLEAAAKPDAILPWTVGAARRLDANDDALVISAGKWQNRLLREFDESSQLALARVRFLRPFSIRELPADAEVLLSYSDTTPALGRRALGTGQFLLANFSPSRVSSELGKHGVFVALMQMLAQELRPAAQTGPVPRVGEPFRFPAVKLAGTVSRLEIVGPDRAGRAVPLPVPGEPLQPLVDRPSLPGVYQLQGDGRPIARAVVQLDPRESDLGRTSVEDVRARFQGATSAPTGSAAPDWQPLGDLHGRPLWPWCLAAAMFAAAAEALVLSLWGAGRGAK